MPNVRYFDPLEKIIELWKQFDREPLVFQNLNIRGNMITIYLPIDEMLAYVNLLQQRGYADDRNENMWIHRGYARNGNYFKVGPYFLRLAQYREKIHNQQDVKYLMERHQDEVKGLNTQLTAAHLLIDQMRELLSNNQ